MPAHRVLQLNAVATTACGAGMLAARSVLYRLFSLEGPLLLDLLAIGLFAHASALALAAARRPVSRQTLMAFTMADAVWVIGSVVILLAFWEHLAPLARVLIIAVALAVELFALLQYRAARVADGPLPVTHSA
jgi:hypothetical protein